MGCTTPGQTPRAVTHPPPHLWADPPPPPGRHPSAATAVDSTHPIGMHSSLRHALSFARLYVVNCYSNYSGKTGEGIFPAVTLDVFPPFITLLEGSLGLFSPQCIMHINQTLVHADGNYIVACITEESVAPRIYTSHASVK